MLAAKQPLVVPMLLRLSHFKLRSIVVLVVSKQKGITLVFKTDPLQSVDINSTFDSIAVIQKFIQREIEGQLRQMFREDLPGIIHRLSQQWIKAKVEAPYLARRPVPKPLQPHLFNEPDPLSFRNVAEVHNTSIAPVRRPQTAYSLSVASTNRRPPTTRSAPATPPSVASNDTSSSSFPELENFDPTYGLRPEGLPTKSVFIGFKSLFTPTRGLADLTEESTSDIGEYDEDESASFDMVDWDGMYPDTTPPSSILNEPQEPVTEYETIPAVGGGTITRPRIYHSQSMISNSPDGGTSGPSPSFPRRSVSMMSSTSHPGFASPSIRRAGSMTSTYFPDFPTPGGRSVTGLGLHPLHSSPPTPQCTNAPQTRPRTPDSTETQSSHPQLSTPPNAPAESDLIYARRHLSGRRLSVSSSNIDSTGSPTYSTILSDIESSPKIIIRPSLLNNHLTHLTTLSHSNHTLSPYTRSMHHFTVRSGPPRFEGSSPGHEKQPIKAKRKRTYRLGGGSVAPQPSPPPEEEEEPAAPNSPLPAVSSPAPSEFDLSDMDRYFRSYDDLNQNHIVPHGSPNMHPSHVRLRRSYTHPEVL